MRGWRDVLKSHMQIIALQPGILPVNNQELTTYHRAGGLMELPALIRHFVGLNSCKQTVITDLH